MMEAILQLQNGGVDPTLEDRRHSPIARRCAEIAALARREGRDRGRASCSVVAPPTRRSTSGCVQALGSTATSGSRSAARSSPRPSRRPADPAGFDREAAIEDIARRYLRFIEVYESASVPGNSPNPTGEGGGAASAPLLSPKPRHLVTSDHRFLDCCPHKALIRLPSVW